MENNNNAVCKYSKYKNLKAEYNFVFHENYAEGTLPDGTKFKVDADKVDLVSSYFFHLNWKGYVYTVKNKEKANNIMLHWLVLGYKTRPDLIVDHINRDKTDCRTENLRFVTAQQNAMNRKLGANNKTGFLGVHNVTKKWKYAGRICIGNERITLIRSDNIIECAQAYNYASELLFKDYCGYRNPVPEPSIQLKRIVEDKCKKYLSASVIDALRRSA